MAAPGTFIRFRSEWENKALITKPLKPKAKIGNPNTVARYEFLSDAIQQPTPSAVRPKVAGKFGNRSSRVIRVGLKANNSAITTPNVRLSRRLYVG